MDAPLSPNWYGKSHWLQSVSWPCLLLCVTDEILRKNKNRLFVMCVVILSDIYCNCWCAYAVEEQRVRELCLALESQEELCLMQRQDNMTLFMLVNLTEIEKQTRGAAALADTFYGGTVDILKMSCIFVCWLSGLGWGRFLAVPCKILKCWPFWFDGLESQMWV